MRLIGSSTHFPPFSIIAEISKQELPVSHSALEGNVFRRYYHFLIFNVLFVFMIGTAILKSIITLIQMPTNIFTMLAESLPSGSTFFIFYIVFNTCTHSLELVQVWAQLIVHAFVTARKLTPTPRSLQRATVPWCFQYYYYYPQNILAMVITIIYSVISPLILVAAVPFFAFALLIFKYQFAYCYIRKYENSGKFFRHVFQYTTDGLIIFQITMVGVLWLKQAIVGGFVVVALIGFTVYFKILCGNLFKSRTKFLPLDTGLRNFDNDSSCAMNEIPVSIDDPVGHSSALMDSTGGLRHRIVGKADGAEHLYDSNSVLVQSAVGKSTTAKKDEDGFAGSFKVHKSSQSDKYEKLVGGTEEPDSIGTEASIAVDSRTLECNDDGPTSPVSAKSRSIAGSTGLGLSFSNLTGDLRDLKGSKNNQSRNSLSLKIHTKDVIEPIFSASVISPVSSKSSSTKEIRLFTVGSDLKEVKPEEHEQAETGETDTQLPAGFLDEHGFYLESYGIRNSGMACHPLASHFDHSPSKITYQDRTSDFETYIHPALLKTLNRKLWLPRNPLYEHWDLDDTIEIDFALNSSATKDRLEFRVQEREDEFLFHSPRQYSVDQHSQQHPQRRSTVGSDFENGAIPLPSPSNWQGCLSDSPPSTAAPVAGSQWDKYDDKQRSHPHEGDRQSTALNSAGVRAEKGTSVQPRTKGDKSRHGEQDGQHVVVSDYDAVIDSPRVLSTSPKSAQMTHSASMTSIRGFAPTSPRPANHDKLSPHHFSGEEYLGSIPGFGTRYKRSASMPPAPMAVGDMVPGNSGSTASESPQPLPSPFLNVRPQSRPHSPSSPQATFQHSHHPSHTHRSSLGLSPSQGPSSASQSPRISFVNESASGTVSSIQTPLNVRSTMFAGPLTHRHTISHGQGNNIHHGTGPRSAGSVSKGHTGGAVSGPGAGTAGDHGTSSTTNTRRTLTRRGTAGAFFNMIFGDPEDDVLDANEVPRFGYETGGMWSRRRGSIDRHDDDDDDDDDEDEDHIEVVHHSRQGTNESANAYTTINMTSAAPGQSGGASEQVREATLALDDFQLALEHPSHLDLTETATDTTKGNKTMMQSPKSQ
ncbi:hypothetical protein BGX28_009272 [Mortierella sp. GBA30]|nr:hypothetical protein BGX28_009272 [Mortierella sp. GBA30]